MCYKENGQLIPLQVFSLQLLSGLPLEINCRYFLFFLIKNIN